MSRKAELYEGVTAKIVEALESGLASGTKWRAPWHASNNGHLPVNVKTHKPYRGVNTWVLWAEQSLRGYSSNEWGTYNAWKKTGSDVHVRKGEKGTTVLLWKPTNRKVVDANGDETTKDSIYVTSYTVFNADQVEGYEPKGVEPRDPFVVDEEAHAFFAALDARVFFGGNSAYYVPLLDEIHLPHPEDFVDTTSYYATAAHEHTHWTGHETRCNRSDFANRFGTESYAAEELVAELGSAYLCGLLGLSTEPREDHAHYIASWIKLLKSDPSAIVTAASKAQKAVDWMVKKAEQEAEREEVTA